MTILTCATLSISPSWYNYDDCSINQSYIDYLLEFSKSHYTDFFCKILKIMLSENPEDRPTPLILYRILSPFEKDILGLKPFTPDKETVKRSLEQNESQSNFNERQNEKINQQTPQNQTIQSYIQTNEPTVINAPFYVENSQIYNQSAPQQQFEYIIQQADGQPIPQLENQYFYQNQQPIDLIQQQSPLFQKNESVNQNYAYVSYPQVGTQSNQVQYKNFIIDSNNASNIQSYQPQVILNGTTQNYSQASTQPFYYQNYENSTLPLATNSQAIINPIPQQQAINVQTSNIPYQQAYNQVFNQYSYNINDKPFSHFQTLPIQSTYPQSETEIANSHAQIQPAIPIISSNFNQFTVGNNTVRNQMHDDDKINMDLYQPLSDQQFINQDIYQNQIQSNFIPSQFTNQYEAPLELENQVETANTNLQTLQINNTDNFQIGSNFGDFKFDPAQSNKVNFNQNNNDFNHQYTTSKTNNNDLMNDMSRRINDALLRTQNILSNQKTGNY